MKPYFLLKIVRIILLTFCFVLPVSLLFLLTFPTDIAPKIKDISPYRQDISPYFQKASFLLGSLFSKQNSPYFLSVLPIHKYCCPTAPPSFGFSWFSRTRSVQHVIGRSGECYFLQYRSTTVHANAPLSNKCKEVISRIYDIL